MIEKIKAVARYIIKHRDNIVFILFIFSVSINFYTFGSAIYASQSPVKVEGVVLLDGQICTNAIVVIGDKNTTSCCDGSFAFESIPRGLTYSKIIVNGTKISEKNVQISTNPQFITLQTIDYSKMDKNGNNHTNSN